MRGRLYSTFKPGRRRESSPQPFWLKSCPLNNGRGSELPQGRVRDSGKDTEGIQGDQKIRSQGRNQDPPTKGHTGPLSIQGISRCSRHLVRGSRRQVLRTGPFGRTSGPLWQLGAKRSGQGRFDGGALGPLSKLYEPERPTVSTLHFVSVSSMA